MVVGGTSRNKEHHGETLQAKEEEVESEGTLPLTPPWGARKEEHRTVEGRTMPSPAALPKEGKAASARDGGQSFLGALELRSCGAKLHVTQSASPFGCGGCFSTAGGAGCPRSLSH